MLCDILNVARGRAIGIGGRGMLIAAFAATLAGCNTTTVTDTTGGIPATYRDRHPIAMKDADKEDAILVAITRNGELFLSPGNRRLTVDELSGDGKSRGGDARAEAKKADSA